MTAPARIERTETIVGLLRKALKSQSRIIDISLRRPSDEVVFTLADGKPYALPIEKFLQLYDTD